MSCETCVVGVAERTMACVGAAKRDEKSSACEETG